MSVTYSDFINENIICAKFEENRDAKAVFDILNKKTNILKMIEISESGKPALAACIGEIENFYDSVNNPTINLKDEFTRKAVGRMVKTVLAPYGYEVGKQREIPKKFNSKYFTSASCYVCSESSELLKMVINDDIMEVKRGNHAISNFHLYYNIVFEDNDCYQTTFVNINGNKYPLNIKYNFRSQGNTHLLFLSEGGLWFGLSFDGHKGDMFVNRNPVIDYLVKILNAQEKARDFYDFGKVDNEGVYEILKSYSETYE